MIPRLPAEAAVHREAETQRESAAFAGYVAHELRAPLATQRVLLELALSDPNTDTANWRDVAEDILDACKQQERLLEACLVLARSERGLCRWETRDLGSLVAKRLRACDLGGLRVRSTLETALVIGDPDLIERLVDNLIGNAIRHNKQGGWIRLSTRRSATNAVLTVENSGPAVPAGEVERLLKPFQQLTGQNGRPAGGLGLGLTVAKAVVDAHGAVIAARARPRGGLRVEVVFQAPSGELEKVGQASTSPGMISAGSARYGSLVVGPPVPSTCRSLPIPEGWQMARSCEERSPAGAREWCAGGPAAR